MSRHSMSDTIQATIRRRANCHRMSRYNLSHADTRRYHGVSAANIAYLTEKIHDGQPSRLFTGLPLDNLDIRTWRFLLLAFVGNVSPWPAGWLAANKLRATEYKQ